MVTNYGIVYFVDNLFPNNEHYYPFGKQYALWRETPEGKDWRAWSKEIKNVYSQAERKAREEQKARKQRSRDN